MTPSRGLLLLNLGSPKSAEPREVGTYLREFLMDPYVIDIPAPLRWILVNLLIIPKRSHASSELYKKIWNRNGSPLVQFTQALSEKVKARLKADYTVGYCMRYGAPGIREVLPQLLHASEITLFPLYPQYSLAATESSIDQVKKALIEFGYRGALKIVPPFYSQNSYLDAVANISRPHLKNGFWDKVLFSFHGLPERQVIKAKENYRTQCFITAREVALRLGLREDQYLVAFQSRLGRTPWIKPYSDHLYESLPKEGVKRLAVLSPSFVADCLETLEEIAIRGRKQFKEAGGEELFLVPSLNSEGIWAEAVCSLLDTAVTSPIRKQTLAELRSSHQIQ